MIDPRRLPRSGARLTLVLAIALCSNAMTATAQPKDGDIALAINTVTPAMRQFSSAVLIYDPVAHLFTTMAQTAPRFDTSGGIGAMAMATNNRDLIVLGNAPGGSIVQTYRRVGPGGGVFTTVASSPGNSRRRRSSRVSAVRSPRPASRRRRSRSRRACREDWGYPCSSPA